MTFGLVAGIPPEEQADAAQTLVRFQENPVLSHCSKHRTYTSSAKTQKTARMARKPRSDRILGNYGRVKGYPKSRLGSLGRISISLPARSATGSAARQ